VGTKIYFDISRTPQERAEAREQVETYLQKRFTEKMIIEDEETRYDFEIPASGFVFVVHPEGNRDLQSVSVHPHFLHPLFRKTGNEKTIRNPEILMGVV